MLHDTVRMGRTGESAPVLSFPCPCVCVVCVCVVCVCGVCVCVCVCVWWLSVFLSPLHVSHDDYTTRIHCYM